MSRVFRAKYLDALRQAFDQARLTFAAGTAHLGQAKTFARFVAELTAEPWVVYAKRPFGGPAHVLQYLGRYTRRVAISNARLVALHDGTVRFRYKDYADGDRPKVMALAVEEFLRRFLLHVVPHGFVRIRYFGLLANRRRRALLDRCRVVLAASRPAEPRPMPIPVPHGDVPHCPACGVGVMRVTVVHARIPPPAPGDTS